MHLPQELLGCRELCSQEIPGGLRRTGKCCHLDVPYSKHCWLRVISILAAQESPKQSQGLIFRLWTCKSIPRVQGMSKTLPDSRRVKRT